MICPQFMVQSEENFPNNTKFFPEYENVFISEQLWLKEHFLPLFSLDLGKLNKDFLGHVIHVVNTFEPYDGCIGDSTKEFHNEFCHSNWFAFQIKEDGKYQFLGNQGYFQKNFKKYYADHVEEAEIAYKKSKQHYQETGKVKYYNHYSKKLQNLALFGFGSFGGELEIDNWTSFPPPAFNIYGIDDFFIYEDDEEGCGEIPESLKPYYNGSVLVAYKNKPFHQVGWINSFIPNTPSTPIILYEPENKIVLYVFQYS